MCRFLLCWFVVLLAFFVWSCLCFVLFCMCGRHLFDYSCGSPDDRPCFIARSAVLKKKKEGFPLGEHLFSGPICKNTCRYCRCQPCDVGVEHDDHTCYSCEQRLLHPGGVLGAPWRPPLTPGCESWCAHCTSQRCAVRGLHELHVCMDCEHAMKISTRGRGWRSLGCA